MAEEDIDNGAASGNGSADASESEAIEVNQCVACGKSIDITGLAPFSKVACPHCDNAVRVRTRLGNFQIQKMLGEGGMSQVFLAEDLALDRQVALKILHQNLTKDAALMALFEREAKLTASIHHPNVVKVYTVGSDSGYFYIAMELVDSYSLEERITKSGALREREALDLLHDVAAGLSTAQKQGLIHRDIKPGNILLTKDGSGKLVDFGLAVQQGGDDMVEDLWATPFYVPPEKLDGDPDTFRGDIYSLGATFFHALAGKPPFVANTASLEELRRIKAKPVSLTHAGVGVSVPTVRLVDRMMAYKPEERPGSYTELLKEIEEVQSRLPGGSHSRVRRQKALADQKKGLSVPVLIGIWGGALAFVGLAAAAWVNWGGGDDIRGLNAGGGETVLSGGEKTLSQQYLTARALLLEGKSAQAVNAFDGLLAEGNLSGSLKGWVHFNRGVAGLMNGMAPLKAAESFAQMGDPAKGEAGKEAKPSESTLFRKARKVMVEPLPVLPGEQKALAESSIEGLALLAFGMKNWNHGEFESAMELFQAFEAVSFPDQLSWANAYKDLVGPYRADAKRLESLPKPSIQMSESELQAVKAQLNGALGEFKTRGGARDLAEARLKRIGRLIEAKKALAAAPPKPPPSPDPTPMVIPGTKPNPQMTPTTSGDGDDAPIDYSWTPEAIAEREQFAALIQPSRELMTNYHFDEARAAAAGFVANEPAMKRLQEDYLVALDGAAAFKERLVGVLAAGDYDGRLLRKEGVPLDCKVLAADPEKLVVDLMFGPNDLQWEAVSPQWIVETAIASWLADRPPSEESLGDWAQAVWFARQTGRAEEAEGVAEALSGISDGFSARWKRMKTLP